MSVMNRLVDAKLLYDAGRHEGALLSVLVAVAGSSRKRFPSGTRSRRDASRQMGDAEAFESFMGEEMQRVGACRVLFGGQCHTAERIFYKWLRCSLAHEAELPEQVVFQAGPSNCQASICRDQGPPERLVITHPIVLLIGQVVSMACENSDVPVSVRQSMAPC
jgi:hypothetical protein